MSPFVPPVPKPQPNRLSLLARFVLARRNVLELLRERNYSMKMGRFRFPGLDIVLANDPALIRRILVDEAHNFPKAEMLRRTLEPAIGNGVFIATGGSDNLFFAPYFSDSLPAPPDRWAGGGRPSRSPPPTRPHTTTHMPQI